MPLSKRQKNIVNPFARENFEALGVADYNLENPRNKFVIDGIHDLFVNYDTFPEVGKVLRDVGPLFDLPQPERIITTNDALVYTSIYPQNGTVLNGQLEQVAEDVSQVFLRQIVARIREEYPNFVSGWLTTSSKESLDPENQFFDRTPGQDAQSQMDASRLIGIRRNISPNLVVLLREAFENNDPPLFESNPIASGARTSPLSDTEQSANLYDWRSNVLPGMEDELIYYNSFEERYYYVRRTDITSPQEYDILSLQNGNSSVSKDNIIHQGLRKILFFAGKASNENIQSTMEKILLDDNSNSPEDPFGRESRSLTWKQVLNTYLDPRPSSRWVYAVRIPQQWVDALPLGDRTRNISDFEIDPLIVAEKLLSSSAAITARKVSFTADQFQRYISNLEYTLRQYARTMRSQGIALDSVTDLPFSDLSVEAEKVSQFPANFEKFLDVNGIEANEDDIYELFLDSQNDLLYVAVNGIIYTRGTGTLSFLDLTPEEIMSPLLGINAFIDTSPVTFGYVYNSQPIYAKTHSTPEANWPTWLEFLVEYTIPKVDIFPNEVDVEVKKAKEEYLWGFGAKKGEEAKLFEFLGEITKGSTPSELATIQRLWTKRKSHVATTVLQIGSNLASTNCSTIQARLMRESLSVLKIINSKTRVRGLIRYALFLIRDEMIKEAVNRRMIEQDSGQTIRNSINAGAQIENWLLGDPTQSGAQPGTKELARNRILKEVERHINKEIFCTLDIIGDVVEQQILDPIGAPPGIKKLQQRATNPPVTFKIRANESSRLLTSQNDAYRKGLEIAFEKFLSTLLVGLMKDLVDAALGCGPEIGLGKKSQEDANDGLLNAIKHRDYGSISLNSMTETLPLTFIAQQSGLTDKEVTYVDGTRVVNSKTPKLSQIQQLHSDVSEIVTSSEMSSLLKGDADLVLLETIKEMINEGDVDTVGLSEQDLEDPIILAQRQESLRRDDTRYAVLGLTTTDIIAEYFFNLGNAMLDSDLFGASVGQIDDPIEAYCKNKRDLSFDTAKFNTQLSDQQLLEQYTSLVNSKRTQINLLCDLLRANLDLQRQIDDFINDFGISDMYNTLLGLLSALSNWAFSWVPDPEPGLPSPQATEFPYYPLGKDLYFQIRNTLDNKPLAGCGVFTGEEANDVVLQNDLDDALLADNGQLANPFYFGGLSYTQITGQDGRFGAEDDQDVLAQNFRTLNERLLTFNTAGTRTEWLVISVTNNREVNYVQTFGPPGLINQLSVGANEDSVMRGINNYFSQRAKPFGIGHVPEILVQIKGNMVYCYEYIAEQSALPVVNQPQQLNFLSATNLIPRKANVPMPIIDGPGASLAGRITEDGEASIALETVGGLEKLPSRKSPGMITLVDSFMTSAITDALGDIGEGLLDIGQRDMSALGQGSESVGLTIDNFYLTNQGRARLGPAQFAFGTIPFKPMNDVCITMEDRLIADACIVSIQQRIRRFLYNTGPLLRVYNYFLTPSTLEVVSDYLTNSIYDDLKVKRLLGYINASIPFVDKVYGGESSSGIRIESWMGEREKIKTIVKKTYEAILKNLMPTEAYKQVSLFSVDNINAGSPPMNINGVIRYRKIGGAFWRLFKHMVDPNANNLAFALFLNTLGEQLNAEQAQAYTEYINTVVLDEQGLLTEQGVLDTLAYLPIPLVFALIAIYYDNSVDMVSRHPQLELDLNTTRAAADDKLLSVMTKTNVTKFIANYRNYPITVGDETYWSKHQAKKGLTRINKVLNQTVEPDPFFVFFNTIADRNRSLEDFPYDSRVGNAIRTMQPGFFTDNDLARIYTSFNEDGRINTDDLSTSPWNTLEKANSGVWLYIYLSQVDPARDQFDTWANTNDQEGGDGFFGTLYERLEISRTALVDGGPAYGGNGGPDRPVGVPEIANDYLDLALNLDWLIEENDRAGRMFETGTGLSHAIWTYIRSTLVPYGYPLPEDVPNYAELVRNKRELEKIIFNNEVEYSGDWDF